MGSEAVLQFPKDLVQAAVAPEAERKHAQSDTSSIRKQDIEAVSDEELLDAISKGSKDALAPLFRRHGRAVLNVAWRILRDESEANDLRQEVFLYIFERASQFDRKKSSGASWIIQITYHRAIDRRRFLCARQHYKSEQFDELWPGAGTRSLSTDEIDGKALLEDLRRHLTPDQQQTLELHFFDGYSFREIAEQNGQTVGNIRHHYYRALERLRSNLLSKKRG
jgi:RNA polymerase sigma-70 factor (ECF subfamily)